MNNRKLWGIILSGIIGTAIAGFGAFLAQRNHSLIGIGVVAIAFLWIYVSDKLLESNTLFSITSHEIEQRP